MCNPPTTNQDILKACLQAMLIRKLGSAINASVSLEQTKRPLLRVIRTGVIYLVRQQVSFWKTWHEDFMQRPRIELLFLRHKWLREFAKGGGVCLTIFGYLLYWHFGLKREGRELVALFCFSLRLMIEKWVLGLP